MKKILSLICLLVSCHISAQQEASNWYFGQNAGIRFDSASGTVNAVTNGQLNTIEGCASISDSEGNLLFYSDGTTVYNRNHSIMQNGSGLFGDSSSSQSAIIVAKPKDPDIYYIFTVDNNLNGVDLGLNYSEVNMALAGGLGGITTKNSNLLPLCSEKITAVLKDCISRSLWVITLANSTGNSRSYDSYHAFEITDAGLNPVPVTSTFGINISDPRGYLKLSPDGTKMACANMSSGLYLYDFDVTTGIVSNQLQLQINGINNKAYGVEFSADSQLLYTNSSNDLGASQPPNVHFSTLTQFNLAAADIEASAVVLDERELYRGGLQLGPDGKIYRALSANYFNGLPFLGVITNPNQLGVGANYVHNAINLNGRNSTQGLPPFDQSLFNTKIDIIRNGISNLNLDLCTADSYTLIADDLPGATYTWTRDGVPLPETDFDLVVTQEGNYEVLIDLNTGECAIEGEAFVSYFTYPTANQPDDLQICDDNNNGIWDFDFSVQDIDVLNGQDSTIYEVLYFETQADADANLNEIPLEIPYSNTSNPQTIFARTQNIGNPNCYDTTSFNVEIFNTPTASIIDDLIECDDNLDGDDSNGRKEFDLVSLNASVLAGQNSAEYAITYHTDLTDADTGANALANPYYNQNSPETVYVRIENINNTNCYDISSFQLIVNPLPIVNNATLFQCDEDGIPEGFTLFNLTEADDTITGGNTDYTTAFYITLADAQNDLNEINGTNFSNFTNPQIINVRVTNTLTGCFSFAELTLEVSATSINDTELTVCDDDGTEDGFHSFNLTDANADVLNGAPAGVTLVYYATYQDALLEENALNTNYTNAIPYSQTIFARAENANDCYGISEIRLVVYELPNIEITDETQYCLNFFPESITLTGGVINDSPNNYFYVWSTGETTSEIEVNTTGVYTVIVSNTDGCFKERTITVLPSNIATITEIEVVDISENNMITVLVSGEGDYEYALDDINGPYQSGNTFENVAPGVHTVYVRDKNGCGIVDDLVSVIGFPKYFTPNNDGYHDTWQVYGIDHQFQSNSKIQIFNRYGQFLAQIDPLGFGWDGSFNGKPLPSSDYWFAVTLQDGRIYKSHFTLKR